MMESPKEEWIALGSPNASGVARLQTATSSRRLNQIDRVRAKGVGDHISLPQLVVCGDQSAGKSSVLEGITGIPFPRADGMCTRFATEIILRHKPDQNQITAKLLPSVLRSAEERSLMDSFERQLQSFEDLPSVIEEASILMGVRSNTADADVNLPAFAADVLRLEYVGNTGLHLTVVDLPGLISVSDNPDDLKTIEALVDGYLESSRTIILAVIQAQTDPDIQGIIQRARKFDKEGERTVGIITKPDLVNKGTEARVASLSRNDERIKLKLGFFLLKNLSPLQLQKGMSCTERAKKEAEFFNSSPWKEQNLNQDRIGIERLRSYLQDLLDTHIERELPKVRKEVEELLLSTERQLAQIGPERSSIGQVRMFLITASMDIFNLIQAALEGNYGGRDHAFFSGSKTVVRLRAKIHKENEEFATYMRTNAAKRKLTQNDTVKIEDSGSSVGSAQAQKTDQSKRSVYTPQKDQLCVTREDMLKWVEKVYHDTRGRELPGNYNHTLLSNLFHEQSSPWNDVAKHHLEKVASLIDQFLKVVLTHVIADVQVRSKVQQRIKRALDVNFKNAKQELGKLVADEQMQPITYNHYYTDNIQRAREDAAREKLQESMDHAIKHDWGGQSKVAKDQSSLQSVASALKRRIVVDMTQQACIESFEALEAYYKVTRKTFVDNVCRQVIERHLLAGLAKIFDPIYVNQLSEEEILDMASETSSIRDRRTKLQGLAEALEESLRELRV